MVQRRAGHDGLQTAGHVAALNLDQAAGRSSRRFGVYDRSPRNQPTPAWDEAAQRPAADLGHLGRHSRERGAHERPVRCQPALIRRHADRADAAPPCTEHSFCIRAAIHIVDPFTRQIGGYRLSSGRQVRYGTWRLRWAASMVSWCTAQRDGRWRDLDDRPQGISGGAWAESGCLVRPAHHGLYWLVVGFYGGRSIGDGRARAGKPDLQSTVSCARSQAAGVPAAVTVQLGIAWKRGGHGRFDGSYEVLASHR